MKTKLNPQQRQQLKKKLFSILDLLGFERVYFLEICEDILFDREEEKKAYKMLFSKRRIRKKKYEN